MSNDLIDEKPDNPPAFPLQCTDHVQGQEGMTLRDYFAIRCPYKFESMTWGDVKAELGLDKTLSLDESTPQLFERARSKRRYQFADAMLEARKQ